jgi:hypothetical protein
MIEITTFRLHDDADAAVFAKLDEQLRTEFFSFQPGLRRRTTACSADGEWASIIEWDSEACADAAIDKTEEFGLFGDVLALMDLMTIESCRYNNL